MIKVNNVSNDLINNLTKGLKSNKPMIYSLVEQNTNGFFIKSDDDKALLIDLKDCFKYLLGSTKNKSFNSDLIKYVKDSSENEIVFFPMHESWEDVLLNTLADFKPEKIHRVVYDFNLDTYSKLSEVKLTDGYYIEEINSRNIDSNTITQSWSSTEKFIESGVGVYLYYQGKKIGSCFSVYSGAGFDEISISIDEEYRNKGFAFALTHKFIRVCLNKGRVPCYSCWPHKEYSMRLAKKLGFDNKRLISAILVIKN